LLLLSREASVVIAAILSVVYFEGTASKFFSPSNVANLAEYTATIAIIAAGEVMVLICGEVDLSVGQVYVLVPFVMYYSNAAGLRYVVQSSWDSSWEHRWGSSTSCFGSPHLSTP
jgi:simple sugar transport system permease protein